MATGLGKFADVPLGGSSAVDALAFGLLNDILASFHDKNAYGRPNQYEVQIHPPRGASPAMGGHNVREFCLRAESLIMPGRSLSTQIASAGAITGPQREYVIEPLFAEEISMTFLSTGGLDERKFFEQWQQVSYNVTTFDAAYYNDYIGTIDIYLVNQNNQRTFGLRIEECFPKSIAALNLTAGPSTEITKTTVAWSFRKFSPLDTASQQKLGGSQVDAFTNTIERSLTRNLPAVLRKLL